MRIVTFREFLKHLGSGGEGKTQVEQSLLLEYWRKKEECFPLGLQGKQFHMHCQSKEVILSAYVRLYVRVCAYVCM